MAEQNIFTRIQLKYDSYERWTDTTLGTGKGANFILKAGEMGICYLPSETLTEQVESSEPPQILFKVGDGKTKFSQLPWASAKAADVYAWAKAANKPNYSANEIGDLDGFFQLKQTDTEGYEYKLQSKNSEGEWVDVANSTIKIPKPSAIQAVSAGAGLTATTAANKTVTIGIDTAVTFILDCGSVDDL